jgi:hypothetical protein
MPTVDELRREAIFAGIKGTSRMNKKQLCEALGRDENCYKTAKQKREEKGQTYLVSELREMAKNNKIKGYSKMKKDELCAALNIPNCKKPAGAPKPPPKAKSPPKPPPKAKSPPKPPPKAKSPPKSSYSYPPPPKSPPKAYAYSKYPPKPPPPKAKPKTPPKYSGFPGYGGGFPGYGGGFPGYGGGFPGYGGGFPGYRARPAPHDPVLDNALARLKALNITTNKEYKQWTVKNHPDKIQDVARKAEADKKFKDVTHAINVLSDRKEKGDKRVNAFYGM